MLAAVRMKKSIVQFRAKRVAMGQRTWYQIGFGAVYDSTIRYENMIVTTKIIVRSIKRINENAEPRTTVARQR